jgi:hypothetical protein
MITASRVTGTPVFGSDGERIGHVHDLSIEKVSGQVAYALLSFGGFLGIGERYQTLPWSALTYSPDRGGYTVNIPSHDLERAPVLSADELEAFGAGHRPTYEPYPASMPMI